MGASDAMTYRGYAARVAFDAADEVFVGHLADIDDVIAFQAGDAPGLKAAFHEAVDDYVATCAAIGRPPQEPYSGRLALQVAPEVHAALALAAHRAGRSVERWAEEALTAAAHAAAAG